MYIPATEIVKYSLSIKSKVSQCECGSTSIRIDIKRIEIKNDLFESGSRSIGVWTMNRKRKNKLEIILL